MAPILLAAAAVCGLLKTSALWGKEDPPRFDYDLPVSLPERRIDLVQLVPAKFAVRRGHPLAAPFPAILLLIARLEESGLRLGATVEAVEKSMGAAERAEEGDDHASEMAAVRFYESRVQALLTSFALRSVAETTRPAARWLSTGGPKEGEAPPIASLWDAMEPEQAGNLLSAGVDPAFFEIPLSDTDPASFSRLPAILTNAGESALELARDLEVWASKDDGSDPEKSGGRPLAPSHGPGSKQEIDLVKDLFGPFESVGSRDLWPAPARGTQSA